MVTDLIISSSKSVSFFFLLGYSLFFSFFFHLHVCLFFNFLVSSFTLFVFCCCCFLLSSIGEFSCFTLFYSYFGEFSCLLSLFPPIPLYLTSFSFLVSIFLFLSIDFRFLFPFSFFLDFFSTSSCLYLSSSLSFNCFIVLFLFTN